MNHQWAKCHFWMNIFFLCPYTIWERLYRKKSDVELAGLKDSTEQHQTGGNLWLPILPAVRRRLLSLWLFELNLPEELSAEHLAITVTLTRKNSEDQTKCCSDAYFRSQGRARSMKNITLAPMTINTVALNKFKSKLQGHWGGSTKVWPPWSAIGHRTVEV